MNARLPTRFRLLMLLVAIAMGIGAAVLMDARKPQTESTEALPVLGTISPFSLTGADGAPLTLDSLRGRVWVANLFFTTCPSICPRLTHNLATLQREIGPATPFDLLSVTVDPAHDTPPVLAAYATANHLDTNRWHFATAPMETVRAFATQNLRLTPGDEPVGHSPHVVLVDRAGEVRGYYDGLDASALARLASDLQRALAETTAP